MRAASGMGAGFAFGLLMDVGLGAAMGQRVCNVNDAPVGRRPDGTACFTEGTTGDHPAPALRDATTPSEAARATGLPMPVAGSAGARALLEQFRSAGRSLPPERWAEVYPGCLAFWPRGKGWQGHVGVVEEVRGDGSLVCLEANARHAEVVARVVHPESEVRLGFGLV